MRAAMAVMLALALSCFAAAPIEADCTCAAARLKNGWCEPCRVGYVASVEVRSRMLFETLDAHGHEINPGSIECRSCQAALEIDGFCEECRWGFVDKKLYFSRLTYFLARGEVRDVSKLTCRTCTINAGKTKLPLDPNRWCDQCKVGMVGNTAYKDRKEFDAASRELRRLLQSIRAAGACEYCGVTLFMDSTCPECNITYKGGKKVETQPSEPASPMHPHPHPH
ncbi:MAG: hypothetical protein ACYTGF_12900 [Planctomycetota bacterium]